MLQFSIKKARAFAFRAPLFCVFLKASAKKETLLWKQKCVQDTKNVFGKFKKKFFASKMQILCLQHVAWESKRGITWETQTLNVSRMFPCLRTQATYLEDAEFVSRKQKCFASFLFAHPYNIVSHIDSKCFCSNVSSFAPTFRVI